MQPTTERQTPRSTSCSLATARTCMHNAFMQCTQRRPRAIPKGHLQFMPAGAYRQAVRLVSPLHFSASLPSHAFPCGRTDLGHGSTMSRTRMYHACVERARPMFESPPRSKRQVQFTLTSQHLSVSSMYTATTSLPLLLQHPLSTQHPASSQSKCLLQINLAGFPNLEKRRCRHANARKPRYPSLNR